MSMRHISSLIAVAASLALPVLAAPVAIVGGNVWTGTSQGTIPSGIVVIDQGQVVSVSKAGSPVPLEATVIDATGKWVSPGFISAFSRTGIVEVDAEDATDDTSASGSDYSVALDAADGFNPDSTAIAVTRVEGVTRIVVAPGASSNLFAGQGFVADTSGDVDTEISRKAFLLISLGDSGAALAGGSRPAAWAQFRAALDDAGAYPARYFTIPVIVDAFSNLPASFEQLGATAENAARMMEAGVTVAISHLGDSSHQARLAIQVAGNAVANGMSHDDAMKALTTAPAQIFGLQGLGVIGPGARADIVVWDGDPLVMIDGDVQSLKTRQTELRDRYLKLDERTRPLAYVKP